MLFGLVRLLHEGRSEWTKVADPFGEQKCIRTGSMKPAPLAYAGQLLHSKQEWDLHSMLKRAKSKYHESGWKDFGTTENWIKTSSKTDMDNAFWDPYFIYNTLKYNPDCNQKRDDQTLKEDVIEKYRINPEDPESQSYLRSHQNNWRRIMVDAVTAHLKGPKDVNVMCPIAPILLERGWT